MLKLFNESSPQLLDPNVALPCHMMILRYTQILVGPLQKVADEYLLFRNSHTTDYLCNDFNLVLFPFSLSLPPVLFSLALSFSLSVVFPPPALFFRCPSPHSLHPSSFSFSSFLSFSPLRIDSLSRGKRGIV